MSIASSKVKELFPNLPDVPTVDLTAMLAGNDSGARDAGSEDAQAGELGKPFTQLAGSGDGDGNEDEWEGWLDWEALTAPGGAAGGSA